MSPIKPSDGSQGKSVFEEPALNRSQSTTSSSTPSTSAATLGTSSSAFTPVNNSTTSSPTSASTAESTTATTPVPTLVPNNTTPAPVTGSTTGISTSNITTATVAPNQEMDQANSGLTLVIGFVIAVISLGFCYLMSHLIRPCFRYIWEFGRHRIARENTRGDPTKATTATKGDDAETNSDLKRALTNQLAGNAAENRVEQAAAARFQNVSLSSDDEGAVGGTVQETPTPDPTYINLCGEAAANGSTDPSANANLTTQSPDERLREDPATHSPAMTDVNLSCLETLDDSSNGDNQSGDIQLQPSSTLNRQQALPRPEGYEDTPHPSKGYRDPPTTYASFSPFEQRCFDRSFRRSEGLAAIQESLIRDLSLNLRPQRPSDLASRHTINRPPGVAASVQSLLETRPSSYVGESTTTSLPQSTQSLNYNPSSGPDTTNTTESQPGSLQSVGAGQTGLNTTHDSDSGIHFRRSDEYRRRKPEDAQAEESIGSSPTLRETLDEDDSQRFTTAMDSLSQISHSSTENEETFSDQDDTSFPPNRGGRHHDNRYGRGRRR